MAADLAAMKIKMAYSHLEKISEFEKRGINGAGKLKKRIQAEINFLQKGLENSGLEEKDVQCSNLGQLGALADVAMDIPSVCGILQSFRNEDNDKIIIDIVGDNGMKWIKVIMRNPKALHLLFALGRRGNAKPLNEVAVDFLRCAELHPVFYCTPKVVFWFCNGVSEGLAGSIEEKGAAVEGRRIPDQDLGLPDFSLDDSDSNSETDESSASSCYSEASEDDKMFLSNNSKDSNVDEIGNFSPVTMHSGRPTNVSMNLTSGSAEFNISPQEKNYSGLSDQSVLGLNHSSFQSHSPDRGHLGCVNLDVTAMIAYVSATSNGGANFIFHDKFLNEQAACERLDPVKKTLHQYFEGKEWVACREAVDRFQEIVDVIGGDGEKARAKDLLARLTVVPGQDFFKDKMRTGGKIRELPRITFGTGQALQAITVTSNMGFIRAAQCQGISLAVLVHQPRALTEAKQTQATPLEGV
ncbi:UPF0415 protein C7orf25 homolog isoform X2 [Eriocheir sinensis]|nr:UPF0415 protein C7orf25 homolog isoform X2 [Eriocheir sinensis]XP_050722934.1 UPF0415 protein C7orf25 homolog isoform X2 [Eriocheir sinensis]XP_050722935.1 UPF0415 protein C7orf25 homolog isoform X2 [Eriocheir sinensis]XP_050722936.1 UPF0415 protein C7orf25 homolog isoform X2 [Eriocheir sinensis]XP_050722937.1 UPF0415 protein C7orf25 homolog isoform X2 [Eriocheir sinensis]XP_050722938.1 UPF0415 protein C7orf25 homolog isoform X2 [Eriocheir sinensis]XP_050722939.1 UPF0415 protein C7orf25 ho